MKNCRRTLLRYSTNRGQAALGTAPSRSHEVSGADRLHDWPLQTRSSRGSSVSRNPTPRR